MSEHEIKVSEFHISDDRADVLTASGVGSCLVIVLYDPCRRIGALGRPMLPSDCEGKGPRAESLRGSCVDTVIDHMVERMAALGSSPRHLLAKIVGGANMFPEAGDDLGQDNVNAARVKLAYVGIPIVGEAVGGHSGRSVRFAVETGAVTVRIRI